MYEFLGTALITYTFSMVDVTVTATAANSLSNSIRIAQVRGFAYFVGFLLAYEVSGAHFNPALTLASIITDFATHRKFEGLKILI